MVKYTKCRGDVSMEHSKNSSTLTKQSFSCVSFFV